MQISLDFLQLNRIYPLLKNNTTDVKSVCYTVPDANASSIEFKAFLNMSRDVYNADKKFFQKMLEAFCFVGKEKCLEHVQDRLHGGVQKKIVSARLIDSVQGLAEALGNVPFEQFLKQLSQACDASAQDSGSKAVHQW